MNYGARTGRYSKADLEEWARTQNPYCTSIEWRVGEKEVCMFRFQREPFWAPYLYTVDLRE
jgi:hypothetical protein